MESGRCFTVGERTIVILEQRLDEADDAEDAIDSFFFAAESLATLTSQKVWDSAELAVKFLEEHASDLILDKRVLELGSGTGFVGLACAALGASKVVLTDTAAVIDYCTRPNAEANKSLLHVSCEVLDWIEFERSVGASFSCQCDVVVASDCVWLVELMRPFVVTVAGLLKRSPGSVCVLAQTERSKDDSTVFSSTSQLLSLLNEVGLHVQAIDNHIFLVREEVVCILLLIVCFSSHYKRSGVVAEWRELRISRIRKRERRRRPQMAHHLF
jgi:predicted nicotinamide N-methyase